MASFDFQFGNGNPQSKLATGVSRVFLFVFMMPFAAAGIFIIWQGTKKLLQHDWSQGIGSVLFGSVFAAVGLGMMYAAVTAGRRMKAAEAKWQAQTDGGQKLWLSRADWAAGKIKSTTGNQWKIMLLMGVVFTGFGGVMTFAILPGELSKGNHAAFIALIFPLIGIGLLIATFRSVLAQRRFGDCFFELAQVPIPLGGSLDGLIQTEKPLRMDHGLHLKLSCIRRTVSGSGDNRSVQENVLWQSEKVFRADANLPSTNTGGTGIPVHFSLPADQPEASPRSNATIAWRLEARAKLDGPNFSATFDLPVFRVAGAVIAASATEADPTASLQMSAEEIRRDEHSRIQVTDGPQGREFYFPAARNVGAALALTLFGAIWGGFLWFMIVKHAPLLFPVVFGLVEIFLVWGCFATWFKSSRIVVNNTRVEVKNRYLVFARARQFSASDVSRFEAAIGMTSGTTTYQDIRLILRENERQNDFQRPQPPALKFKISAPAGIAVATSIASKPEADWLVREMNRALGR